MMMHQSRQQATGAPAGATDFHVRGGSSYTGAGAGSHGLSQHKQEKVDYRGSSPQYFGRGRTRTRERQGVAMGHHDDVPQSDAITLVSKERLDHEELPGTINWVVYLMVATIGTFLTWMISTNLTGIVVTLSLVPPLILSYGLYWWRHRAKVAPVLYWGTFWGGIVASIIFSFTVGMLTAWLISLLSMGGAGVGYKLGQAALSSIVLFGIMEESVKYLVLKAVKSRAHLSPEHAAIHRKIIREGVRLEPLTERETLAAAEAYPGPRQIRHPYGMVLLGMAAGMGFGILENILWTYTVGRDLGWVIPIFRSALAIPFHAMLGGLIGEKLARNQWFGEENGWLSCTWLPILLHAAFDFCLLFLGVLAVRRSFDREDEIGFTSGALAGAFLVFLATAAALWYLTQRLYDDSESLPAIEWRPTSMLPRELQEDFDVEDPDAQRQRTQQHTGTGYTTGTTGSTSSSSAGGRYDSTKASVIRAEEEERRRRLQEAEERAEHGLPPKTGFVPRAVHPADEHTSTSASTNVGSAYPKVGGTGNVPVQVSGTHGGSNLNPQSQSWVPQGLPEQTRQSTENQQQLDQLKLAEQARLHQRLAEQQQHSN